MKHCLVLSLTGMLVFGPSVAVAQTQSDKKNGEEQFDVYVRNLDVKRSEFEELINKELFPQRKEFRKNIDQTLGQIKDHLVAIRSDPGNEKRKAAYEQSLSLALTQVSGFLKDFQDLEPETLGRLNRVTDATVEARENCQEKAVAFAKEAESYAQKVETIEMQLWELSQKFQSVISEEGKLPADVDLDIRLLEADLKVASQGRKLAEIDALNMEVTAEDLATQLADLSEMGTTLKVAFRRAAGQQMLLTRVARLKQSRLSAEALRRQVAAFGKLLPDAKEDAAKVDEMFNTLFAHDLSIPGRTKAKAIRNEGSSRAIDILKAFSKRPSPKHKETDDGKSQTLADRK